VPDDLFEQVKLFLPKYLTPAESRELFEDLKRFPQNKNFYLMGDSPEELLQGDGWKGFVAIDFHQLEKRTVSGVILSNSCDIDVRNARTREMKVLFAPLIRLSKYEQLLTESGKARYQVDSILSSIRQQTVTYIFYFPSISGVMDEGIIVLDDIHAHPLGDFLGCSRTRLFTLNQYAFYIFLIKLSIHFSRFQENISRHPKD